MIRNLSCLVALALAAAFGTARSEAPPGLTPPAEGVKTGEATAIFTQSVAACLGTRADNKMIADLPSDVAGELALTRASEADRGLAGPGVKADTPVWITKRLGFLLAIAEPSPDRCEVWTNHLPVEATVQGFIGPFRQKFPEFQPQPIKPVYNPIVYQYELVQNGARYVIHLEGAERGAAGQGLPPFSVLFAIVQRQAATEKPPFR